MTRDSWLALCQLTTHWWLMTHDYRPKDSWLASWWLNCIQIHVPMFKLRIAQQCEGLGTILGKVVCPLGKNLQQWQKIPKMLEMPRISCKCEVSCNSKAWKLVKELKTYLLWSKLPNSDISIICQLWTSKKRTKLRISSKVNFNSKTWKLVKELRICIVHKIVN